MGFLRRPRDFFKAFKQKEGGEEVERLTGIEPVSSTWKAEALTLVLQAPNACERQAHDASAAAPRQVPVAAGDPILVSANGPSFPEGDRRIPAYFRIGCPSSFQAGSILTPI